MLSTQAGPTPPPELEDEELDEELDDELEDDEDEPPSLLPLDPASPLDAPELDELDDEPLPDEPVFNPGASEEPAVAGDT